MSNAPQFKAAYPYQKDVLALPVTDLDTAARWYTDHFGMRGSDKGTTAPWRGYRTVPARKVLSE